MPLFRRARRRAAPIARCLTWPATLALGLTSAPALAQPEASPPATPMPGVAASSPAADVPAADAATSAGASVIRTIGAISYVCGGVGADEQQRMQARRHYFNLALLFTQGARGEYLSDVDVRLMRDGHDVARFRADGPLCLIKAPEGGYNVSATYNGQSRSATVRTGARDTTQVRW